MFVLTLVMVVVPPWKGLARCIRAAGCCSSGNGMWLVGLDPNRKIFFRCPPAGWSRRLGGALGAREAVRRLPLVACRDAGGGDWGRGRRAGNRRPGGATAGGHPVDVGALLVAGAHAAVGRDLLSLPHLAH